MELRRFLQPKSWTFDYWITSLYVLTLSFIAMQVRPQSDTWWLLRTGEIIVEQGTVPVVDNYSTTAQGQYWANHEWLTEALMYGTYSVGGINLLIITFALCIVGTWIGVYSMCDGSPRYRCILLFLGLIAASMGWAVRPQIISAALFVLVLRLIFARRWWWLPAVILAWANLHAGVFAGLIVLGIATVVYGLANRSDGRKMLLIVSLCGALTLVNPLGFGLWRYVFNAASDDTRSLIQEWQAPSFREITSYPFIMLCALTALTIWHFRKTLRSPRDRVLVLGSLIFAALAWKSVRHSTFFELLALPLVSRWFLHTVPRRYITDQLGRFHQMCSAMGMVMAVAFTALSVDRWQPPLSDALIKAVSECPAGLFNTYDIGGELIWFVRNRSVFIDNRQDPYAKELVQDSMLVEQHGQYHELFKRYEIRCAVVPHSAALSDALRRDRWRLKVHEAGLTVWEFPE